MSPPSRAAWIEIVSERVAQIEEKSPPSRAAWIEILAGSMGKVVEASRRLHGRRGLKCKADNDVLNGIRRRLHGRRGLKYLLGSGCRGRRNVAAFTGGVD